MIRMRAVKNAGATIDYFVDGEGLTTSERVGVWCGKACEPLGIAAGSEVGFRDFALMLDGYDARGRAFVPYWHPERRCGFNLAWSAPKSVSVAALCWKEGGAVIRECFVESAQWAVGVLERLAKGRANGERRPTGSVAAAVFVHESSRYGDPHLHAHMVLGNVTWDGAYSALEPKAIAQNHMTLDRIFQRDLAVRLGAAGMRASMENGVVTLPVADAVCRRLSRGASAIEEVVERAGVTGGDRKALNLVVNDRIRPEKAPAVERKFDRLLSRAELRELGKVRGPAALSRRAWRDGELWLWMRREIRAQGFETERARWNVALRAGMRDVGRSMHELIDRAVDGGLMFAGAERTVSRRVGWSALCEGETYQEMVSAAEVAGVSV